MNESFDKISEPLAESKIESKKEKVIGILTLTRHSKTKYTEKYPDITEEGLLIAQEKARGIKTTNEDNLEKEDRLYVASPNPRARGTLDVIKETMGDNERPIRVSKSIRSMDVFDMPEAVKIFQDLQGESRDPELVGKKYHIDDRFENQPEVIEPRSKVNQRALRALEYLIRQLNAYSGEKKPHVFATSHFEVINPIVAEVFELDPEKDKLFGHVEDVRIEFLETKNSNEIVPMIMYFRGMEKRVFFDRKTRKIIS